MGKFILCVGCSSSGKSTFSEELCKNDETFTELNRDRLRFFYFTNSERDWGKYKHSRKNESFITKKEEGVAELAAECGMNIISSNTNLNPKIRKKWKQWAESHGYTVEYKYFHCDWKTLVKRNAQREGGLPEHILWDQYKRYMQQFGVIGENKVEVYSENPTLDSTIIVDMDGTMCDMEGIRKPYEWDKVGLDKPRHEIIDMVRALASNTGHVTFMSGRDGVCYLDTYTYIQNEIMTDDMERLGIKWELHMRPEGDSRKDDIIKYELYLNHVKGKRNVSAVFDDRLQVIRMWDILDMPNIIQVGKYNNEF